ncbi:gentisate 1,2-dioxygenase [Alphaproteobacteria bacterium]|nr:gentisate 1,2-dioxygenase [Alphaproteobacteria bacterium]
MAESLGLHDKPETTLERAAFYEKIDPLSLAPLWDRLSDLVTREPHVKAKPHIWKYDDDVRPHLMATADLITAEEAERRVLVLENPGLKGQTAASDALFAGLQLILPGEIAPTHRHSPAALRFIVEGEGAYTSINGEKTPMAIGDLILTPSMVWHDHGNEGKDPVVWLDGLDMPLVRFLGPVFAELYNGGELYPEGRPAFDNMSRYGANMLPIGAEFNTENSPVFHYPYKETKQALLKLHNSGEIDPCHGIKMRYVNPANGGPVMPTIDCYMQLLPGRMKTEELQSTAAWIYSVVEGTGTTIVGDTTIEWGPRDVFVVPGWHPHHHRANGDAFVFSFTDKIIQDKLGLYRERRGNVTQ